MQMTEDMADAIAALYKSTFDGAILYLFAGPIPASASAPLDMVNDCTELAVITESGDGMTGLTWTAPADGQINKAPGETWEGTNTFDGVDDGEPTLTATFARLCLSSDNGRGETTAPRLQFIVGQDVLLNSTVVTAGLTTRIDYARIVQGLD